MNYGKSIDFDVNNKEEENQEAVRRFASVNTGPAFSSNISLN